MPAHADAELIGPLLDGPFEDPLWSTFLDRLRQTTGADYASLIFRPPAPMRPSLVHLFAGEQWPPVMAQLYRDSLHERDPVRYHELAEARVYALDHLLDPDDPQHAAYMALARQGGLTIGRIMRVVEPSGVSVWLSVCRRDTEFDADHDRLLGGLAPYLRSALRGLVAMERERFKASVASEAIRRLDFGWMSLDAKGRVLQADAQAAHLLASSDILQRGTNDRLAAHPAALDREIGEAIRQLAADPRGRPRAMILSRDPWLDMLLVPARGGAIMPGPSAAVIAYVHSDRWSSADRCDQLAELFKLLPSEARLALALSRGMTITEAAADLGLTVETARNYSKKIYAKTGARGQPDLVRFIHRSVLAIA